jgi:hypothetical protein
MPRLAPDKRSQLASLTCVSAAAFGVWATLSVVAPLDAWHAGPRLALLPSARIVLALAAASLLVARSVRKPARVVPLLFAPVLLLPLVPGLPPLALAWTGPLAIGVWIAIGLACLNGDGDGLRLRLPAWSLAPRHALVLSALLSFAAYAASSWAMAGVLPNGDEPHYLILCQSLLRDGDLRIENNHARRDYEEYFDGELPPHYLTRGRDGQIYSVHAPGLPLLILPAFALAGHAGVMLFLSALSALGTALVWRVTHRLTLDPRAAWFAWAATALSAPFLLHAFSVYPDALGGVLALSGVALLVAEEQREPARSRVLLLHGAALAMLPWLHSRFAVLAGMLGLCAVLRLARGERAGRRLAAFLALPVLSATAWLAFFWWVYGTPNPAAPYAAEPLGTGHVLEGLLGLLFDQQFGLTPNAPVLGLALLGFGALWRRSRRLAVELGAIAAAYLLVVSAFPMWWGGSSAPARFTVAILPILGIVAGALRAESRGASRSVGAAALGTSVLISASIVSVHGGELAFNDPDGRARLWAWLSDGADLRAALPSFLGGPALGAALDAAIWLGALAGAYVLLKRLERRAPSRAGRNLATLWALAGAGMLAGTLVSLRRSTPPLQPQTSELRLLQRYDPALRPLGVEYQPLRFVLPDTVLRRVSLGLPFAEDPEPGVEGLPAGRYQMRFDAASETDQLAAYVGQSLQPLAAWTGARTATLDVPVSLATLRIALSRDAPALARAQLRPIAIAPSPVTSRTAVAAARYAAATVFALDDAADLEREGLWVAGGRTATLVVEPARDGARLALRNAPVPNQVTVEIAGVTQALSLTPGEERILELSGHVPTKVTLTASTGFRPRRTENPEARPTRRRRGRLLGVFVTFLAR